MTRRRKIAKGLDIGRKAELMAKSAKGENLGKERWLSEFTKGVRNWSYWMRIVYPYVMGLSTAPDLKDITIRWKEQVYTEE